MHNHHHHYYYHDVIFVSILYVTDDGFLVSVQYFVHVTFLISTLTSYCFIFSEQLFLYAVLCVCLRACTRVRVREREREREREK